MAIYCLTNAQGSFPNPSSSFHLQALLILTRYSNTTPMAEASSIVGLPPSDLVAPGYNRSSTKSCENTRTVSKPQS